MWVASTHPPNLGRLLEYTDGEMARWREEPRIFTLAGKGGSVPALRLYSVALCSNLRKILFGELERFSAPEERKSAVTKSAY